MYKFFLKILRKTYLSTVHGNAKKNILPIPDKAGASSAIFSLLSGDAPCMIGRFGATELSMLVNYIGIKRGKNPYGYITGKSPQWWWHKKLCTQMQNLSGFFPVTEELLIQFCEMMLIDMKEVDILGSWLESEKWVQDKMPHVKRVRLQELEPFWDESPWTKALENKKILVVHPFTESILQQYETNRSRLFINKNVLPEFDLTTVKAVQSLGGDNSSFRNWFEALEIMKNEIDTNEFDICLIGCGAYGFPLAAHVKRTGRKAVHLGGALQLLFGIRGKRWEDPQYGVSAWGLQEGAYLRLMNEYWVRPDEKNRPANNQAVEGGCYW